MRDDDNRSGRDPYLLESLRKGLAAIDAFARRGSWSLAELTLELGQTKPTVFRILHTLEEAGFVRRQSDGRYLPGPRLQQLGAATARQETLRWQALGPLQDLAASTGETAHVSILHEGESVCVQAAEGPRMLRMRALVGRRTPVHASALGKALLAQLSPREVDAILTTRGLAKLTPRTIVSRRGLHAALAEVRVRGFAVDDEEIEAGLRCVAAPIPLSGLVAAVGVSAPAERMTLGRVQPVATTIRATAAHIADLLRGPRMEGAAPGPEKREVETKLGS
ncbi:MAG: IclR family transcriptional regulator [Rhodospirillales bacterium]|jgi:IclR family acetate operon transcriptional repressor|nr:IclR family transcriptional regulator [Rhodospirillales bacterium]